MENRVGYIRDLLEWCDVSELKQIRAIINGKIGKRKITSEQQAKMQAARKRKVI
jgi:hypothetical protein